MRKNIILYLLLMAICISACSGIRRYTFYHSYEDNNTWKNKKSDYTIVNLSYDRTVSNAQNSSCAITNDDTLCVQIIPGNDGLCFGPAIFPVFPVFLWRRENHSKLNILLSFSSKMEKEIDFADISLIINDEKEIYPVRISQNANEYKIYFDERLKTIKKMELRFNGIDNPLFLKRKCRLDYNPLFFH